MDINEQLNDKQEKSIEIYNYGLSLLGEMQEKGGTSNSKELSSEELDELRGKLETQNNRILNFYDAFQSEEPAPSITSDLIREAINKDNETEINAWLNSLDTHIEAFDQFVTNEIAALYHRLYPVDAI